MTLQDSVANSGIRIPYPDAGVQTASSNSIAIKGNSIDLAEVTSQGPQTSAFGNAPYSCSRVVAS